LRSGLTLKQRVIPDAPYGPWNTHKKLGGTSWEGTLCEDVNVWGGFGGGKRRVIGMEERLGLGVIRRINGPSSAQIEAPKTGVSKGEIQTDTRHQKDRKLQRSKASLDSGGRGRRK